MYKVNNLVRMAFSVIICMACIVIIRETPKIRENPKNEFTS